MNHWTLRLIMTAMALLSATTAVAQTPYAQRLEPTGARVEVWLDDAGLPVRFAEYVQRAQALIAAHHHAPPPGGWPGLTEPLAQAIGPRQWPMAGADCTPGNTDGVLLVHGLTDSPYLMRDLGDALASQPLATGRCTLVRSLLLPGHGTVPGDLLAVKHTKWTEATRYGVDSFAGEADRVHFVGFSTGGALGIQRAFAQQNSASAPALSSLVLLSPAIEPRDRNARRPLVLHWLSWLMNWLDEHDDRDFAKYESFPLNAGVQIAFLDQALKPLLRAPIPVPVFMAVSRSDDTIAPVASIDVFLRQTDPRSRMWLVLARDQAADDDAAWRARRDQRVNVLDVAELPPQFTTYAHTSFPVSALNAHYGTQGPYVNCLHYAPKMKERFEQCISPAMRETMGLASVQVGEGRVRYGETVEGKAPNDDWLLRRLTFNPRFDDMLAEIRQFLQTVVAP